MTIWTPDLTDRPGPVYAAIADALGEDVDAGSLAEGTRLPTHRELAYGLGVTVGTVSRAYKEAERRGLIAGEIGRGTFVKKRKPGSEADAVPHSNAYFNTKVADAGDNPINFRMNCPLGPNHGADLSRVLQQVADNPVVTDELMPYSAEAGMERHRHAAAKWASWDGLEADPGRIVITNGAHHAMTVAFSTMLCPGDTIATDGLTYPGLRYLAGLLHMKLKPLPRDNDGILPEAFEAACRNGGVQAAYLIPTVHNPLGTVMSDTRRRELAEIAERHRVWIMEDHVYSYLIDDAPPAITKYAPNVGFYINSASKLLSAGMRVGMIYAPREMTPRLANGIRITSWMTAPLVAEVVFRWMEDGTATRYRDWHRAEARRRNALMAEELKYFDTQTAPNGYHLWLRLPESWRGSDFVHTAQSRGVLVTGAEQFAVTRGMVPDAVRVSFAGESDPKRLQYGISLLKSLLNDPSSAGANFI